MPDRISFDRADLRDALNTVGKVKPWQRDERTPGLVRFEIADGIAIVTSANLDATIHMQIPCGPGEACIHLPFVNVLAAVEKAPAGAEIAFAPDGDATALTAGRFRSRMSGRAFDFGPLRQAPDVESSTVSALSLRNGLRAAAPAASNDDKQPFLSGVYLHNAGGLALVAMDDHRIHAAAGADDHRIHAAAILPDALASLLVAVLPDTGDVAIAADQRSIAMRFGAVEIVSTLIEGTFPAYEHKLAVGTDRVLRGRADQLLSDIDLASTVSDIKNRDVRLDLGAKCEVSAFRRVGNGFQSGAVVLDAEFTGAPLAIGFQMRLISDALTLFGRDQIEWRMGGPLDPTIISSTTRPSLKAMISPFMLAPDHQREAA